MADVSNEDRFYSFMLSADDLAELIGCDAKTVRNYLVDQHGDKVTWSDVADHDRTQVWFEWPLQPLPVRIRAVRKPNGALAFRTVDACAAFGWLDSRTLHPAAGGVQ